MRRFIFMFVAICSVLLGGCKKNDNNEKYTGGNLRYVFPLIGTGARYSVASTEVIDLRPPTPIPTTNGDLPGNYEKGYEPGQTIPAVLEPNGMNFWVAQTEDTEQKEISPYYYGDTEIQGFRNSHWIVGGCTQDYGSMTLMPLWGTLKCLPLQRASKFSHEEEISTPFYYKVNLQDYHIQAEFTATSRTALFRFTWEKAGDAYLVINPNSDEGVGTIRYNPQTGEVSGCNPVHRIYQGWGEYANFDGHFVVIPQKKAVEYGTYCDEQIYAGDTVISHKPRIGLYLKYHVEAGEEMLVKVASSFTDLDGARNNLKVESPDWDFSRMEKRLADIWEKKLQCIEIEGASEKALNKFYTSLYHASFLPHEFNDVDGRYPSFSTGTPIRKTEGTYYEDYSLWDTYRALHPLLCILDPQKAGDMMQSLIDKYEQGGWLPIFPCWNSYTSAMLGDHSCSVITDAYVKGIRNFDIDKAYEALRKNAFETPSNYEDYRQGKGRRALESYLKYGYIPLEDSVKEAFHKAEQVSRTLEYAYDDYVLSQLAQMLGHKDDARLLWQRAFNYRNVFDKTMGYVSGRYMDGTFVHSSPFHPYTFITEGLPCHYTWYVPHDVAGLIQLMGGYDAFIAKLDSMFTEDHYWHGNEPCHQVAYLYAYAGQPWKTQQRVRHILNTEYDDNPDGLSGNDDSGQMSAWYIFSALGFYPVCPGTPYYVLGSPSFKKAVIHMATGKDFTIVAENASEQNIYIQSVKLNGKPYHLTYLHHKDIMNGGVIEFIMGDKPNMNYGKDPKSYPPSASTLR